MARPVLSPFPIRKGSGWRPVTFSLMAWVWLNDYDSGNNAIMVKRAPGSHQGWMFYVGGLNQGSEAKKPGFGVSESADPRIAGNSEVGLNRWHHLAVAFHSSVSSADLFMDGA